MEIQIRGYVPASQLLEKEPSQWHALVVLDSGIAPTDYVKRQALTFSYLQFDDVEDPRPGKTPPSLLLIEQALEFAKGKDKLLVSCRAGQSRSPALAYVICCQELKADVAVNLLEPTRHRPNPWIIELGAAALGNAEVRKRFQEWRKRHNGIKLSDHYDELEKEFDALTALGARDRITRD